MLQSRNNRNGRSHRSYSIRSTRSSSYAMYDVRVLQEADKMVKGLRTILGLKSTAQGNAPESQ